MWETLVAFFNDCVAWVMNNVILAIVLAAAALLIIIVLIAIGANASKKRKLKKQQKKAEQAAKAEAEKQAAEEKKKADAEAQKRLEAEKKAAAKKAMEERLEAQRLEAEREEAAAKAEKEKAEAEKLAAEKKAADEKKKAEKKAAEKKAAEKKAEEEKKKAEKKPAEQPQAALYDELKDAEEEDEIWYDEDDLDKVARYAGKWCIYHILTDEANPEDDMYFFELHASNGEKLLSSEEYTTYAGALRGIETHKTNILNGNFKITLSKKGDYIFKLLSGKNMLLCMGENYPTKTRCENAIRSAKRFAKTAIIDENVQDYVIKTPKEDSAELPPLPDGYNGKWIISCRDGMDGDKLYYFELFANNGEKLLSSEEYTTYIGAVNGIQTHKNNIKKGNFRISLTKRGDYIYKLLNGNGQLLCLGEHYKTKRRCANAVESVKRFAENSPVLTEANIEK
jgi:uncharacterized protein YegP (UPF0339 family)